MQAIKNCNCGGKKKTFTNKPKKCRSSSSKSKSSSCSSSSSSCPTSSSSSCSSSSSSCSSSCILIPTCSSSSSSCSRSSSCTSKSSCSKDKSCCKKCACVDCKCLVKKYDCNQKQTKINECIILALEFILSKLTSVRPIIESRKFGANSIGDNIKWYEKFFETVLCVLTKGKICDCVTFKFCKVKNDEDKIAERVYLLTAHYKVKGKKQKEEIPLELLWTQLTRNDGPSFLGINTYQVADVQNHINIFKTKNITVYVD